MFMSLAVLWQANIFEFMCVSHLMNLSNIIKGKNTRPHRTAAMEQKRKKKFINLYGNARYRIRTNELRGSVQMVFSYIIICVRTTVMMIMLGDVYLNVVVTQNQCDDACQQILFLNKNKLYRYAIEIQNAGNRMQ